LEIQEMLNTGVRIPPGEYEGPFLIAAPAEVAAETGVSVGAAGTAANTAGAGFDSPVLYVREPGTAALNVSSNGVKLSGLMLQASEPCEPALLCEPDTQLDGITVFGTVVGKAREEGFFDIPYQLFSGKVPAGKPFELSIKIRLPVPAELVPDRGVTVSQKSLPAGVSTIGIELPAARAGSLISRRVAVKTGVTRYMHFTALSDDKAAARGYAPLLFEPEDEHLKPRTAAAPKAIKPTVQTVVATPVKAKTDHTGTPHEKHITDLPQRSENGLLSRGMHYPLARNSKLQIEFFPDNKSDVDAYVFSHDGTMKMTSSKDLVFFGNESLPGGAVRYLNTSARRAVFLDLEKLPGACAEMDFIYGAYDEGEVLGTLRITTGADTLVIKLGGGVSVITAFEIKRTESAFILTPLIMPYRRGMRELIRSYGLSVT
jgi:stress response protein SCP2